MVEYLQLVDTVFVKIAFSEASVARTYRIASSRVNDIAFRGPEF